MKKILKSVTRGLLLLTMVCFVSTGVSFAEEADTIDEAFRNGTFKGTIGSYIEYTENEAANTNTSWATGYITLKYETLTWNRAKFGTRFFAHYQLLSNAENDGSDPYGADIETNFTVPEVYLNYGFLEESSITIGRWNHKKVSHIDDAQSEGGYLSFKEIEDLELIVGAMTQFAEIDYDDSEDFGRTNDSQDVDSDDAYGAGSGPMVVFVEAKYKPFDILKVNPYYMHHNNYANVFGIDVKVDTDWKGYKYGGKVSYQHVNADIAGSSDANIFTVQPYIKRGPVALKFNYIKFDDGDSLNKPGWLADPSNLVDQDVADANTDAEIFEVSLKYKILDDLWASYAYGTADYTTTSGEGDGYSTHELQAGYNITKNLDVNVRYFIVGFDNVADEDYNKVESRVRFKF